ncbi:Acyclic sesquiterpene synthase [Linum grandiflorum]
MRYCCLTAASIIFCPELSHARISCVKHGVIAALIDEIYDMNGSRDEQLNLIHLLERWDVVCLKVDFASERVEMIYWALHNAICETAESITVGLGPIILPFLYLLGPKLPDEVVRGPEVGNLFNTMSVYGRLLNDRISIDVSSSFLYSSSLSLFQLRGIHVFCNRGMLKKETGIWC